MTRRERPSLRAFLSSNCVNPNQLRSLAQGSTLRSVILRRYGCITSGLSVTVAVNAPIIDIPLEATNLNDTVRNRFRLNIRSLEYIP